MKVIKNPHDKFVKETLGDVEITRDFLQNYLPEYILGIINTDTLTPAKDTFVTDLKEYFSDLLFQVEINGNAGYLYFLFEHKSYKENDIAIQLLSYLIEIWKTFRNEETKELPVVIPLVIYHGKSTWDVAEKLSGLFHGYDQLPKDTQILIPDYKYLLYDMSAYSDEEIKGEAQLRVFLDILKHIFDKDSQQLIARIESAFQELDSKRTGLEYFEVYLKYILNVRNDIPIEKVKKRLSTEGRKRLMSVAEELRKEGKMEGKMEGIIEGRKEGKIEGKKEGKIEGMKEGKIEVAKNMLKSGIDEEQIVNFTGLTKDTLKQIKEELSGK